MKITAEHISYMVAEQVNMKMCDIRFVNTKLGKVPILFSLAPIESVTNEVTSHSLQETAVWTM